MMKNFPVFRLNEAITDSISEIVTMDIEEGIEEGLQSKINFVDEKGGLISTIAEISEVHSMLGSFRYVKISATYCQML